MKQTLSKRISWLDFARSFAIVLVVWNHVVEQTFNVSVEAFSSYDNFSKAFFLGGFHLGRFGVPIFLMITGYLVLGKQYELSFASHDPNKRSYGQFLKRNYLRLLLCIEIWLVVYYIFCGLVFGTPLNFSEFLNTIFLSSRPPLMHIWYIYMILGLYIIVPFISYLLHNMDLRLLILPLSLTFFTGCFLPVLNLLLPIFGRSTINWEVDTSFFGGVYLLYAVLGYLVRKQTFKQIKPVYWAVGSAFFFLLGTAIEWFCYAHDKAYLIWYDCFTLVLASFCLFMLLSQIKIKSERLSCLLADLSKSAFGIYLIHALFLYICKGYLPLNIHPALSCFVYFIIVFSVSYAVVKLLGKIPKIGNLILYL